MSEPIRFTGTANFGVDEDSIKSLVNAGLNKNADEEGKEASKQCYAAATALALAYIGTALFEIANVIEDLRISK